MLLFAACAPPKNTITLASPTPSPTTPLAMTGPTFHVGEVGVAYAAVSYSATGGVQPYHWAVSAGALPGGLTLGSDGSISGTPTTSGDFSFTVGVADSGDSSQTVTGNISIAAALTAHLRPECASYCNVELGCTTACGNFGTLTGGVGPFSYSLASGPLPAGTSLNGFGLSGTFTGQTGWLQFTVQASDSLGATTTISPKFWMYPHVSFNGGRCDYLKLPCTANLSYSGGTVNSTVNLKVVGWKGGYCANASGGVCPQPPITGSGSGGTLTVTIGPVGPNDYQYPTGTFTVLVTSSDVCDQGSQCQSSTTSLVLNWTG